MRATATPVGRLGTAAIEGAVVLWADPGSAQPCPEEGVCEQAADLQDALTFRRPPSFHHSFLSHASRCSQGSPVGPTGAAPIRTDCTFSREGRGRALPLPLQSDFLPLTPPPLGYAQTRYPAAPLGSPG